MVLGTMHLTAPFLIAVEGITTQGLTLQDPLVLGPIAAFIFTIFVSEVVVPGKAYRREVKENERLRALVEKVVPLAEQMLEATKDMLRVGADTSRALDDFLRHWDRSR